MLQGHDIDQWAIIVRHIEELSAGVQSRRLNALRRLDPI